MITPIPKRVRSHGPSALLSLNSGSSVSLMDCSIDLVRMIPMALPFRVPHQRPASRRFWEHSIDLREPSLEGLAKGIRSLLARGRRSACSLSFRLGGRRGARQRGLLFGGRGSAGVGGGVGGGGGPGLGGG